MSPSRARLLASTAVVDSSAFAKEEIRGETITRTAPGSGPPPFCARARARVENARPSLTGQERSGPAGRLPLLFFFCSQTARQLVFCLSIFISAVTSVYYCWYLLLCYVCVCVCQCNYYVSSCEMSLSIKWSCEDGVIRVVSY